MFYYARRFVKFCLVLFYSCVFSPFNIAITSLEEERANLSAFRTFVRLALVLFSLFFFSSCLGWAAACDFGTPFFLTLYVH